MPTVKFVPIDIEVRAEENESFLAVAQKAGLTDVECCGMNPLCGKCKISVVSGEEGLSEARKKELEYCQENGFLPYQRLGCLARISKDAEFLIELERYSQGKKEVCQKANLEL